MSFHIRDAHSIIRATSVCNAVAATLTNVVASCMSAGTPWPLWRMIPQCKLASRLPAPASLFINGHSKAGHSFYSAPSTIAHRPHDLFCSLGHPYKTRTEWQLEPHPTHMPIAFPPHSHQSYPSTHQPHNPPHAHQQRERRCHTMQSNARKFKATTRKARSENAIQHMHLNTEKGEVRQCNPTHARARQHGWRQGLIDTI